MIGNFVSIDNDIVIDLKRFSHELRHIFGSGHTHFSFEPVGYKVLLVTHAQENNKTPKSSSKGT